MTSIRSIGMVLFYATIAVPGRADTPKQKAELIVAASKAATGGAAWDKPLGCTERGTHGDGAISYLTRFSLHAYGMRTDGVRAGNTRSTGFDGKASWRTAGPGQTEMKSDPASLQEAILTNYLSINGFFFPERFPATLAYLRSAKEGSGTFDVIEITPQGGRSLEVWFDRKTHFIKRVADVHGTPAVRVEASDYRPNGDGLVVAYRLDVFGPDGTLLDRGTVTDFQCGAVDTAIFAPPADR